MGLSSLLWSYMVFRWKRWWIFLVIPGTSANLRISFSLKLLTLRIFIFLIVWDFNTHISKTQLSYLTVCW